MRRNIYEELEIIYKSIESDLDLLNTVRARLVPKKMLLNCFKNKLVEIKENIKLAVEEAVFIDLEETEEEQEV